MADVPRFTLDAIIRAQLAVVWHPDKHPEGPEREAASKKFLEIQKVIPEESRLLRVLHFFALRLTLPARAQAYDALMSTDEEATVEALSYK